MAQDLARAAVWIGERADSAELQFEGWRDCASIAVLLGAFSDAWEAVERAAAVAPRTRDREHAEALVLYSRAFVASQPDVWQIDDALRWTNEAEMIFARTDAARLRATKDMRAYLHYLRGEYAAGLEICRSLWAESKDVDLAINLAGHLVANGQADDADDFLSWARLRIEPSDSVTFARQRLIEGRARAQQKRWNEAAERHTEAAYAFRSVGMEDSAIHSDLARIRAQVSAAPESLAVIGSALVDLRKVVAISMELDRREPSRRRRFTVEAVEYLRELAEANALTADLIAHVEDYIEAITRGPARPFVRPVPTHVM